MKKYLPLLLLPLMAILNSCQKIPGTAINGANGTTTTTTTTTGTVTYQPLTPGSTWKYRTDYTANLGYQLVDTDLITMSANTLTLNGKVYNQAYESRAGFGIADTGYYYVNNHDYSTVSKIPVSATSSYAVEMLYLKDNSPVGTAWSSSLAYPILGTISLNGKITEKGISKTFAGHSYANVIHSTIVLTMVYSGQAISYTYEMYAAPNVGLVHIDLNYGGYPTIPEDLIAYTIK